jgi:hypothetical protein
MTVRCWSVAMGVAALLAGDAAVFAQSGAGNQCRTPYGICEVRRAPIGSRCACGRDAGSIIPGQALSSACGTYRGVCRVPPGPVGAPCSCYGDPGRRLP